MKFFKALYIQPRFFALGIGIVALFVISYFVPFLYLVSKLLILVLLVCFIMDLLFIFLGKERFEAKRTTPERLSNGDHNTITLNFKNNYPFKAFCKVIDEIPVQFQKRDFNLKTILSPKSSKTENYHLRPVARGEYVFGNLNVYVSSIIGLVSKRYIFDGNIMVPTYPSYLQLKQFELMNLNNVTQEFGIKKVRRLGHTMEFEQIKEYVLGDDLRTINWKATAKKNQLMVNQFQDEKAQSVYSIIDKGRVMQMPFNGLSLLDYAINSTLVMSSIILRKHDKAGVLSFSKTVDNFVVAERRSLQMHLILDALYKVNTDFFETDFSRLYAQIKRNVTHRSLILLYTNFETLDGLKRQLQYLKAIAKDHLLIVIFFNNVELNSLIKNKAETIQDVYDKVIAEKFAFEKRLIVNELKKYGIHSILTEPEQLTVNTINKYLEVKSRGLI
ncbi:MAG: DUF58 domain-containing protein [Mangrovimonas sp.]|nr:DUF58 domain-containing protein [Mangrovimonas sp.]